MDELSPPPGGDQSKAHSLRVTTVTTFVLVLISVSLRLITRRWVVRQLGWDDFTIVLAAVSIIYKGSQKQRLIGPQIATALSVASNLEGLKYGNGRHAYYLTPTDLVKVVKLDIFDEFMVILITCLTKVSICLFVLRILTKKNLIRFIYALIISLFVVNGATLIVLLAQCRPLEALWNPEIKGHCWRVNIYLYIGYLQGGMFSKIISRI